MPGRCSERPDTTIGEQGWRAKTVGPPGWPVRPGPADVLAGRGLLRGKQVCLHPLQKLPQKVALINRKSTQELDLGVQGMRRNALRQR